MSHETGMVEEHLIGRTIDPPAAERIKEWIHFKYFFSDRINRMDWIWQPQERKMTKMN
jgi:hypothetical protein